jgi:signal transduction histidine kinase
LPRGFTRTKGLGLKIISYRASVIGGSVEFSRRPGGGTVVTCTVPYNGKRKG